MNQYLSHFLVRVTAGLVIIGLVLSGIVGLQLMWLDDQSVTAKVTNMMGRQRYMAAKLSDTLVLMAATDSQTERIRYRVAQKYWIDKLKSNQAVLLGLNSISMFPPVLTDQMHKLAEQGLTPPLSTRLDAYLQAVANIKGGDIGIVAKQVRDVQVNYEQPYVQGLDETLAQFQAWHTQSLAWLKLKIALLWGFAYIFMVFAFRLVFRGAAKRLQQVIVTLDRQKRGSDKSLITVREHADRYDLALRGTVIGVWDWDIETNRLWWSPLLMDMLGIQPDMFIPHLSEFEGRLHPDDHNRVMQLARAHLMHNARFDCEYRIRHMDGHYVWCHARGQAQYDSTGKAIRMVGAMDDISARKKNDVNSHLFKVGLEASSVCVGIIDMRDPLRRFSYASPALCALTGYDEARILSANLHILSGPETALSDLDRIDSAMKRSENLVLKITHYRADGSSFLDRMQLVPVPANGGTVHAYVTVHYDLSQDLRREYQEASRQRLESLGALSSAVAHEINNLLVPMMIAHDIIAPSLSPDADPYAREHLDLVRDYADQAQNIVRGILTFTRKNTEDMVLVSIPDILREAIDFMRGLTRYGTDIKVVGVDDAALMGYINPVELRQVLTNLVHNAEYAMKDQSGRQLITISVRATQLSTKQRDDLHLETHDFIVLTVADTGMGMPPEIMERIFEPLFTTKPVGQGTGLGLSVAHGILRSWGGAITVSSTVGQGTRFDLYIPRVSKEPDYLDLADVVEPPQAQHAQAAYGQ